MTEKESKKIMEAIELARKQYKMNARHFNDMMFKYQLNLINRVELIPSALDLLDLITKIQQTDFEDSRTRASELQSAVYAFTGAHENLESACRLGSI